MLRSLINHLIQSRHAANLIDDVDSYNTEETTTELALRAAKKAAWLRDNHGLDFPAFVHLETLALCNAACSFCPYPTLERKGVRMSDKLIAKIIDDLTAIPRRTAFQFAPYKVSEPFLENRLFDILDLVNHRLPNARITIITNASPLTSRKIEQLGKVKNLDYIHVSVNSNNPGEYEKIMHLPFDRTVERMQELHAKHAQGVIKCPVRLSRVRSLSHAENIAFINWVNANYPRFGSVMLRRNDWIGEIAGEQVLSIPDAPCRRWFDLSITATGVVAMCCMDGSAKYPKGDVNTQHVLDIYNQTWLRELRRTTISRRQAGGPCNQCTYLAG